MFLETLYKIFQKIWFLRENVFLNFSFYFSERTHQCPKCPRAFARKWQLQSHVKANHVKAKTYNCEKCSKNFKTNQALAGHMKSGHKVQTKTVVQKAQVCEICGDILVKNHQCLSETTSNVTKTCQICNKTMDTKALRHHLQVILKFKFHKK